MNLETADRTLREILSTYYFFIPRFQRPYSWEPEQVEELWEDAIRDSSDDYFIGSMVGYRKGQNTVAIIDGQQRLTTLMMLLCAIRDAADKHGQPGLANGTHTFIEKKDEDDESRFVLNTETTFPYLHDEILSREEAELNTPAGQEEVALQAAYNRLVQLIDAALLPIISNTTTDADTKSSGVGEKLKQLRDRILGLRIIFVLVTDQDDATTIFVTLNSRGKDLEPSDLVKAHLFQLLPKKQHLDTPRRKWDGLIDRLDNADPPLQTTEFLLTSWRSRRGNTSSKKLHRDIRKEINKQNAKAFLDDLVADSVTYLHVTNPDTRKWAKELREVAESLRFFRDFGIRQPMPLLLSLLRQREQKKLSASQLARALRAIEDYVFRWTIMANKSSSGGMSLFYARIARDLLRAKNKQAIGEVINELSGELRLKQPLDAEFDQAFSALWFTNDRPTAKKTVQYALRRIYKHQAPNNGDSVDFSKMTIEHLAPQASATKTVGRIGNLIYVTDQLNAKLDSKAWAAKRQILKQVKDEWIPDDVIKVTSWSEKKILERTNTLAELGRTKIWKG